ncbi:hypothetical protein WKH56_32070 [Priestia sp. SB1]|uniref:hypothetical protein n=1 Tax=Priestia TaxID=2800373 RepID=UPI00316CB305
MSKQIHGIQEIKLLDSQIHLCNEIKRLLKKKERRHLHITKDYTEHDIVGIALNRLMSELISRH